MGKMKLSLINRNLSNIFTKMSMVMADRKYSDQDMKNAKV